MPTACITQPQCRIGLCSERLEITGRNDETGRDELLREIPLRDLDRLIVHEGVQITSAALGALLQGGIPISFLGSLGQYLGGFQPAANHHGQARLSQYARTLEAAFALSVSGRIVAAKIYSQRRVLQHLVATRGLSLEHELVWFQGILAQTSRSSSLNELRGFEGASTARYFQVWERFLPAAFPFESRSTRPPRNPVNACISFTATLVYTEMVTAVHAHGLDPALGLLHSTENGRWSLALDLMEPFRPVLVEALTLDLLRLTFLTTKSSEANTSSRKRAAFTSAMPDAKSCCSNTSAAWSGSFCPSTPAAARRCASKSNSRSPTSSEPLMTRHFLSLSLSIESPIRSHRDRCRRNRSFHLAR